jgi:hypothetical protein
MLSALMLLYQNVNSHVKQKGETGTTPQRLLIKISSLSFVFNRKTLQKGDAGGPLTFLK